MKKKRNSKNKSDIWLVLTVLFVVIFSAGVIGLTVRWAKQETAQNEYNLMVDEVNNTASEKQSETVMSGETETEEDVLSQMGIEIPEKNLDWDALHEENPDIYAWIYVPETTVDYPILQHPTDDTYYLDYNIDGTKGFPGCIYTEKITSKDFSDAHTVIYGHNLRTGLMFTSLHNFEDKELFDKDNYIYIYTEDYVYVYEIFAAYEYSNLHLLLNYDFNNEYVFQDFLDNVKEGTKGRFTNFKDDVEVGVEDKIVSLSTCTKDSNSNYRYLVSGVLRNPRD